MVVRNKYPVFDRPFHSFERVSEAQALEFGERESCHRCGGSISSCGHPLKTATMAGGQKLAIKKCTDPEGFIVEWRDNGVLIEERSVFTPDFKDAVAVMDCMMGYNEDFLGGYSHED